MSALHEIAWFLCSIGCAAAGVHHGRRSERLRVAHHLRTVAEIRGPVGSIVLRSLAADIASGKPLAARADIS